jgi:structural maintenance of chromosome 2
MQGKITQVLNMKPTEILGMVEEAAGTRMYEDRKDKALKTIAKKDAKLLEIVGVFFWFYISYLMMKLCQNWTS